MGMFDSIKCELPLLNLPQSILNHWVLKKGETAKSSDVIFQTKDTPDQGLSLYKIDSTGQLLEEKVEGYYEEPKLTEKDIINDPDNKEPQPSFLSALGKYNVTSRTWEKVNFTGVINFYESYDHLDKPRMHWESASGGSEYYRYTPGWIEYQVQLIEGRVQGDVTLSEHTEPIKHTDEEIAAREEQYAKQREEMEAEFREHRKKYPSAEQKLIDNIDRECKLAEAIMDESDLSYALTNIRVLIREYRKNTDRWYEEIK